MKREKVWKKHVGFEQNGVFVFHIYLAKSRKSRMFREYIGRWSMIERSINLQFDLLVSNDQTIYAECCAWYTPVSFGFHRSRLRPSVVLVRQVRRQQPCTNVIRRENRAKKKEPFSGFEIPFLFCCFGSQREAFNHSAPRPACVTPLCSIWNKNRWARFFN